MEKSHHDKGKEHTFLFQLANHTVLLLALASKLNFKVFYLRILSIKNLSRISTTIMDIIRVI